MSDLFHDLIPEAIILHWLRAIHKSWRTIQVATKPHDRMKEITERIYLRHDGWLDLRPAGVVEPLETRPLLANVGFGVTVGMASIKDESIAALKAVKATVRYLSMEPPCEHIEIGSDLADGPSHWVIGGGESGAHMDEPSCAGRWMKPEWAYSLRDQCSHVNVPFFFKQLSPSCCLPMIMAFTGRGFRFVRISRPPTAIPSAPRRWADEVYETIVKPWGEQARSKDLINLKTGTRER